MLRYICSGRNTLHVAVAAIRRPTAQRVIVETSHQRFIVRQRFHHGCQIGVKRRPVLPSRFAFVVPS